MRNTIILLVAFSLIGAGCILAKSDISPGSPSVKDEFEVTPSTSNAPADLEVTPSTSNTIVDLSNQNLTSLPSYILERTDIEELYISGNQMTGALPAEIRHLSRLRVLDASDNQFTGVPAEIGQLERLEILDFSNNNLTGLPYELGNLKALKVLDLSGNDYSEHDLEIIRENLPPDVEIRL